MSVVYLNGEFVPISLATVSVTDGGWLHGAALFETMRAENGRVFRLESHVGRLLRSAAKLLRPVDRAELPSRVDFLDLLERNELKLARVRMTVSAGALADEERTGFTVCVTASPLAPPDAQLYQSGVAVVICNFKVAPSDPLAAHKTTAYLARLLALRQTQSLKCAEALWFTTGNHLAEGSITNVFIAKNGLLTTPPESTPVLPGIARGIILDLARQADVSVRETPITIDDLFDADEVMLTSSIIQVLPVIRIEKHDVGDGLVGPLARRLLEAYRALVRKECGTP